MRGFLAATGLLTIVPVPTAHHARAESPGASAAWFPVVGALMGLGLAGIDRALSLMFPAILSALLTVTAWKLTTGGLHLDGLADSLDGLMGRDPQQRLSIMRDSRIGTFGAVGLILVLLLAVASLAELSPTWRWRVLVAAPAVGRAAPPLLATLFGPALGGGQGAIFVRNVRPAGASLAVLWAGSVALGVLGGLGLLVLGVGALVAVGAGLFLSRRLGGVTGDVLGAAVELTELSVLLALVASTHLGAREP